MSTQICDYKGYQLICYDTHTQAERAASIMIEKTSGTYFAPKRKCPHCHKYHSYRLKKEMGEFQMGSRC